MHPTEPKTERQRVRFNAIQHIQAEPEAIFPLLCPVREHDWIPPWKAELIYTKSGIAEEGCVFRTNKPGESSDVWVMTHYEPSRRVGFVRVDPLRAIRYDIRVGAAGDGSSRLLWQQEITALDEAGDLHVAELRQKDFLRRRLCQRPGHPFERFQAPSPAQAESLCRQGKASRRLGKSLLMVSRSSASGSFFVARLKKIRFMAASRSIARFKTAVASAGRSAAERRSLSLSVSPSVPVRCNQVTRPS